MAAGLSLGALLTFGTGGTALAPSAHAADSIDVVGEARPTAPVQGAADFHLPAVDLVDAAPIVIPAGPTVEVASIGSDAPTTVELTAVPGETTASAGSAEIDLQIDRDPNEFLKFDDMNVPRWIVETILRASEVTDVDPVYMMALADKESSFLPDSKARTSSAEGLFQFISSTWLEVVHKFGEKHGLQAEAQAIQVVGGQYTVPDDAMREAILDLRRDPYLSALMAAEMKKRDRELMERRLGRSISRSEFYLAHFFGVNSASKFVSLLDDKPKQSAPRVFPAAARANKSLFYAKKGRKTRHLTVSEVFDKIDEMIDKRIERYEDVATIATADASL